MAQTKYFRALTGLLVLAINSSNFVTRDVFELDLVTIALSMVALVRYTIYIVREGERSSNESGILWTAGECRSM